MSFTTLVGHGLAHEAMSGTFGIVGTMGRYATNSLAPYEAPSVEQLMDLAIRGWIDETALKDGCLLHGVQCDVQAAAGTLGGRPGSDLNVVWKQAYYAHQTLPTEVQFLEIANRQFWDDGKVNRGLQRYGYYADANRQFVTNLRYDIPGPADLVRFSVRHVWEPDLLQNIGYDQEFPGAIIDVWHAMKGLDYPLFTGPFASQIGLVEGDPAAGQKLVERYASYGISEPTWAKAYWWAHWVLPSPGQGYEMLFRLDPERDPQWDPPQAVGKTFTYDDLALLLRANDYPPKYRPLLASIAYRMPGVRFIRDFFKQGVYDAKAVYEWARRWGYGPQDRLDITNDIVSSVQGAGMKPAACKGCATCEQAFEVGVLTDVALQQCLTDYGADPAEAARLTATANLSLAVKRAREVVANIRKRYLAGKLSVDQARNMLTGYQLAPARIADYIDDWQLELEDGQKEISAQQAVRYACQGIITGDDLQTRLENLGYSADAIQALLGEAAYCAANLATQAAAKMQRAQKQAAAQLYQQQRRARQAMIEAQAALAKHGSPTTLRKWFCEGAIGEVEVYSRLNVLGWPDLDITRFLSDCKSGVKPTPPMRPGGG